MDSDIKKCWCDKEEVYTCGPCMINNNDRDIWEKLNDYEKLISKNYLRAVISNKKITVKMMETINKVHEKYNGFYIGCIQ